MNNHIKDYVKNALKERKAGIFGTGNNACIAKSFLEEIEINEYVFFDNNVEKIERGKNILSPSTITKNYFILISTIYFQEIKKQLEELGLKEIEDFIWILDLKFYDALLCFKGAPQVPDITFSDLDMIEKELMPYVEIKKADWFEEADFEEYEEKLGFQVVYKKHDNKRYRRKIMEYYCTEKLLKFDTWVSRGGIYLDVGAAGSPFAKYLRENKSIEAYALDLNEGSYSELDYYIREDATNMHFQNNEVRGISMQSSFEMFAGDADIEFIKEGARVLEKGGKIIILPLYLHKKHLSTVSPNYYHLGLADEHSTECIRTDCRGSIPFARFYDVKAFNERVLKTAKQYGLTPLVYSLPQELVEKEGFVYLKFILSLEKTN